MSQDIVDAVNQGNQASASLPKLELPPPPAEQRDPVKAWNAPAMIVGSRGDFLGGYDNRHRAGTVAYANHHIAPGKKQWTWGNHDFGYAWDRSLTDNDGPYVELMSGAYTDNQPDFSFLAPDETKTFSQYWYPIGDIGVPDLANLQAALRVENSSESVTIHLQVTENLPQARLVAVGITHH
jgi:Domain of unknown function (DUF5107)